jgi:hypothetical protein
VDDHPAQCIAALRGNARVGFCTNGLPTQLGIDHMPVLFELAELQLVKVALSSCLPHFFLWDLENRDSKPPWGDKIATHIASPGN